MFSVLGREGDFVFRPTTDSTPTCLAPRLQHRQTLGPSAPRNRNKITVFKLCIIRFADVARFLNVVHAVEFRFANYNGGNISVTWLIKTWPRIGHAPMVPKTFLTMSFYIKKRDVSAQNKFDLKTTHTRQRRETNAQCQPVHRRTPRT